MKTLKQIPPRREPPAGPSFSPLEYVVDDWLETGCEVRDTKRSGLVREFLGGESFLDAVALRPAISVRDRLISIVAEGAVRECWIYYSGSGKLEKYSLKA
ncbi:MAG: hypothetical protein ACOY3K_08170 [Candidatus Omnitrophota bacterium]